MLKKRSNKVHNLDMDGANNDIVSNMSATNEECLSIISVDLNTENIYENEIDENIIHRFNTFHKRRMSQP